MIELESPCINVCKIENDVCIGCGRTLEEIAHWTSMSNEERRISMVQSKGFTKGSEPIYDSEIINSVNNIVKSIDWNVAHKDYVQAYTTWLEQSTHNKINLSDFKYANFSYGTTTAFAEFISRHHTRTVRFSRDDFLLSKILCTSYNIKYRFIEDGDIAKNDCVIVSLPFTGNGTKLPNLDSILDQCDELDVPVMIDGAYFGIGKDVSYELDRKCIKEFTTSHSKNFALQNLRIGIRYSKDFIDDALNVPVSMADCYNKLGAYIAVELMKQYSSDYIIDKYWKRYLSICEDNNLTPTNTITLARGDNLDADIREMFTRGNYVRLCVSKPLTI